MPRAEHHWYHTENPEITTRPSGQLSAWVFRDTVHTSSRYWETRR